jgi:glycosyltransferase involved in cell wall biosynthesis
MTSRPLVSVYLPTRNRAALLPRAVRSVLRQDYDRIELLIVDDSSTDRTPDLLAEFAAADPRVRTFHPSGARGASAARNVAISAARGEFVTGLDDDDIMLPTRISRLLEAHRDDCSLVCSSFYLIGGGGRWYDVRNASETTIDLDRLLLGNAIGNQALVRADRMREVGLFDEEQPAWQDYDLWTRLVMRFGPALRLAEPTYVHFAGSGFDRITGSAAAIDGARRYYERYEHRMGPQQRAGQRLLQAITARRRLTLSEAGSCWSSATGRQVLGYWVRSNVPATERLLEAYRRWRKPAAALPFAAELLLEP